METTGTRGRKQPGEGAAERKAREAEALRLNLLKRKAQQRQRRAQEPSSDPERSTRGDGDES